MDQGQQHLLIIGGGIIGCATAHYARKLISSTDDLKITIVDKVNIAAGASGKAGGFLACDWHNGATLALAAHSFHLHKELADEFTASKIGYRPCRSIQVTCKGGNTKKVKKATVYWDGCEIENFRELSNYENSAQVVPEKLTRALFDSASAELVIGNIHGREGNTIIVETKDSFQRISCTSLLLSAGPWTSQVAKQLGISLPFTTFGQKAYSVLLADSNSTSTSEATCLFLDWKGSENVGDLEIYSRLDGFYVCGCGENPDFNMTEGPEDVKLDQAASKTLVDAAASVSSILNGAKVIKQNACYLPITERGLVAGEIEPNVYIASGHSCWGILNGPATGAGMAEIILKRQGKAAKLLEKFSLYFIPIF
eukprot:g2603.t1